ncbi:MAG: carbohydrate-binding protein [Sedimentisphaerales bacterium]|nr:carbohydrate-binding protein [Sedimentisphaerales bacterium]
MKKSLFLFVSIAVSLFCFTSNTFAVDGWASMDGGTTGGEGGTVVEVNNVDDFTYYAEDTHQDPYIIYVNGNITLSNNVRVRGNKTIIGRPGSHISGNLKCYREEESNNIFRYLDIDNYNEVGDGDCISIDSANHIWVDHCTFTDGGDGNVDIKNGADYITISWCKFQYTRDSGHNYTNLIGHSDDNGSTDRDHLLVTVHHNWYSTMCKERMPRVRFGQVHVYNNYYSDLLTGGYCIGVGVEAHIRVESNYFDDVYDPWKDYYTGNGADGHIGWNTDNIFNECTVPTWATNEYATIFVPPYAYTLDNGADVPAIVQNGAGADGNDSNLPHWAFGPYGDFDRSGLVDTNDLAQFAAYWLETDCNQVFDADYDSDCNVNNYELSLLAENWKVTPPDTTPPAAPENLWAATDISTILLDWADNNEPDLTGYNLYRSTTSGSGYSKLNVSPLTDSNYTDSSFTYLTTYYYVVTAVDTSENESSNSVEAFAIADGNTSVFVQENAMGFCNVDGIVDTEEHSGYTGYGYADTENALGNGVDWKVSVPSAGTYYFAWRYANGSSDRGARLLINDVEEAASINFPATGGWEIWQYLEVPVSLTTAGIKNVRLEATGSSGLANTDYFRLTGTNPQIEICP